MVSAFAARQRLALGQVKVADKVNEIVAIPSCWTCWHRGRRGDHRRHGCQRAIAQKTVDKKADYILALKGNQGALREDVDLFVAEQKARDFKDTTVSCSETVDGDHGRIETRAITVIHDTDRLQERHAWPGLKSIILVESTREISDKTERETRFYITSLVLLANPIAPLVRDHGAVENSLHWVLDMAFRDDECRLRTDHAPANFTTLKHMALNLIRGAKTKDSMAQSRRLGR